MMRNNVFGVRVTGMMTQRGLSRRQLANRINIKEDTLYKYLSGAREPKASTIRDIACILNTTSDFLLGVDDMKYSYYTQEMEKTIL